MANDLLCAGRITLQPKPVAATRHAVAQCLVRYGRCRTRNCCGPRCPVSESSYSFDQGPQPPVVQGQLGAVGQTELEVDAAKTIFYSAFSNLKLTSDALVFQSHRGEVEQSSFRRSQKALLPRRVAEGFARGGTLQGASHVSDAASPREQGRGPQRPEVFPVFRTWTIRHNDCHHGVICP